MELLLHFNISHIAHWNEYFDRFLGSGLSGSTVYCGLDIVTGELVALAEWSFKSTVGQKRSGKIEDEKLLKQVSVHVLRFVKCLYSTSFFTEVNLTSFVKFYSTVFFTEVNLTSFVKFYSTAFFTEVNLTSFVNWNFTVLYFLLKSILPVLSNFTVLHFLPKSILPVLSNFTVLYFLLKSI